MLKKGGFHSSEESRAAFEQLKEVLMSPLVLSIPNFEESFMLECDASKVGIGVILNTDT